MSLHLFPNNNYPGIRCDGVEQCLDGVDEQGCSIGPVTNIFFCEYIVSILQLFQESFSLLERNGSSFLATLVALHFTPVSK